MLARDRAAKVSEARAMIDPTVEKELALIDPKAKSAVESQKQKDILKASQDLVNAELKIDNTFDSWLDTVNRTMELTGAEPGIIGGSITAVLGKTKANEFYEGFVGGITEYAAAVGRIAIPGARATRIINLFKETAPGTFSSISSGIQTTVDSLRNALATDMSREPDAYITGYSKMNKKEQQIARKEMTKQLQQFERDTKEGLYKRAYNKNPLLVPKNMRGKIKKSLEGDDIVKNQLGLDPDKFELVR